MLDPPSKPAYRKQVLLACAAVAAVYLWCFATVPGQRVAGDGYYSWIIARSLGLDGDLHFANDYATCGDPWRMGVDRGGGRPANPFFFGPALIWAPVLRLLKAVMPIPAGSPPEWESGCAGPLVLGTMAIAPIFGALTVWLGYRVARRFAGHHASLVAMLVVAFCSSLLHHGTVNVAYSHLWAAFGVGVGALSWIRATEEPESLARWFYAGLGIGVAALMRSQAVLFLLAPAISLGVDVLRRACLREWPVRPALAGVVTLLGFGLVFSLQLYETQLLYGRPFVVTQGDEYLQIGHSRPFALLLGARGGLLYWHPLMWLAVIGLVGLAWRRSTRLLGLCLLLPAALDVYLNGAVDWHGTASFGARRLTALATLMVVGSAVSIDALWAWLRASRRRLVTALVASSLLPWVTINLGASAGNPIGNIPWGAAAPMPLLFSVGARNSLDWVHDRLGNVMILPALAVFAARYRVAPAGWDRLTTGGVFEPGFVPLRIQGPDGIAFDDDKAPRVLAEGLARGQGGATLAANRRGRLLVEIGWAHATHIALTARPSGQGAASIRVRSCLFFGCHDLGSILVPAGGGTVTLEVPRGSFDTGINEVLFESDQDVLLQRLRWIDSRLRRAR